VLKTNSDAAGLTISTGVAGGDIVLRTASDTTALTLDSSQNATFAGDVGAGAGFTANPFGSGGTHEDLSIISSGAASQGILNIGTDVTTATTMGALYFGTTGTSNSKASGAIASRKIDTSTTDAKADMAFYVNKTTGISETFTLNNDGSATFAGDVSIGGSGGTRPLYVLDGTSTGQTANSSANIVLDDTAANLIEFLADAGEGSVHGLYFSDDTTGRGRLLYTHSTDTMSFYTNSTTALTINSSQNATFSGNVTAFSDRKLKDNLEVIPNALDKVSQLTGYTYDRIDMDGVRQSGLIAQDVQEVLPEVIFSNVDPDSGEETLSVAYGNMIGLLVEAVKELKAEVEELKGK
jgi:hypothetical protein